MGLDEEGLRNQYIKLIQIEKIFKGLYKSLLFSMKRADTDLSVGI